MVIAVLVEVGEVGNVMVADMRLVLVEPESRINVNTNSMMKCRSPLQGQLVTCYSVEYLNSVQAQV